MYKANCKKLRIDQTTSETFKLWSKSVHSLFAKKYLKNRIKYSSKFPSLYKFNHTICKFSQIDVMGFQKSELIFIKHFKINYDSNLMKNISIIF